MARIIYNEGYDPLVGSLGGYTFQNSAAGSIVRMKPLPNKARTPSLLTIQEIFTLLARAWLALPGWRKTEWNDFAAIHQHVDNFGISTYITGMQWFMSAGMYTEINQSYHNITPPVYSVFLPPSQFSLNATSTELTVDWPSPYTQTTAWPCFYFTPPMRSTTIHNRRNVHYAGFFDLIAITSFDVTSIYESLFNLSWPDIYNNFHGQVLCHLKQVHEDEGIASIYVSSILTLPI